MLEAVKETLSDSYNDFIRDMADPDKLSKSYIESVLAFPITELFDSQKNADCAKQKLGKAGFQNAVSLYFNSFKRKDSFDFEGLLKKLTANEKVVIRLLGKDKFNYLKLLTSTMQGLSEKRKGLLIEASA